MQPVPKFPRFKPVELEDRRFIMDLLRAYSPETSELTFTNLFIWRKHYNYQWSVHKDWLYITGTEKKGSYFALEPVGPAGRADIAILLLEWLAGEKTAAAAIERAGGRFVRELAGLPQIAAEETREHFDYVYLTSDLIDLPGGGFRNKRNYINQFLRAYGSYSYEPLEERQIGACLEFQEQWCSYRRCDDDLNLMGEWEAIKEALVNYRALDVAGAVISLDGVVKAFTIGEVMGDDMAVVHVEKADPGIPGLYQFINQQFCARQWLNTRFINREQDLGISGLRTAKLSYNPHHFVEKYRVFLKRETPEGLP